MFKLHSEYKPTGDQPQAIEYLSKGITAHPIKLTVKKIIGDIIKIALFELLGIIPSFTKSLKPSANGCKRPKVPTTLGPLRRCIAPKILRSAKVKYATAINKGTIIIKILIKDIKRNIKSFSFKDNV